MPVAAISILVSACLAVGALAGLSLRRSRVQHRQRAEVTAQNLCTVLADGVASAYAKIDLAVLQVQEEVEAQLATGRVDSRRIDACIERQRHRIPEVFALRVAGADGLVERGTEVPSGSDVHVEDRDFFLRLKGDPAAGLVFSKPLTGRFSGRWSIILARRVNRPDGSFGGVVYGALDLERLQARFARLTVGREAMISLRDPDLTVIAHHGGTRNLIGTSDVSVPLRALLAAGQGSGTYDAIHPLDGIPRVNHFVKIQPYAQVLIVGLGAHEVFEAWRREVRELLVLGSLFLLLVGLSTLATLRAWRREALAERERERMIADLQRALADVKTLSGLIPICSHCKKIRDDQGYWNQIEGYIASRSEAHFTHGICPECSQAFFAEVFARREAGSE